MLSKSVSDFDRPHRLEGQTVVLEEISPKYFPYIIKWRNNPDLNKFLNQPYKLTMASEQNWYKQYLQDKTQGFYMLLDKISGTPFGTIGWTNMDLEERICVMGRLLVGDLTYRGSLAFVEHTLVLSDWFYEHVDKIYIHVAVGNNAALRFNSRLGFHSHDGTVRFPEELCCNGLMQMEMCRSREEYETVRDKFQQRIESAIDALC